MAAVSNSLALTGSSLKPSQQYLGSVAPTNFSLNSKHFGKVQLSNSKRTISVQAAYSDGGRSNSSSIFVSGFVLGGLIVGTLGAVYAPQKTRKVLAEKIAQLNSAIDDVSGQLRPEDDPDEVPVNSEEVEAIA
ncbi:uncharacterized protein LOC126626404 isoform X2 [Malus sylvestris]|uniref:uncharacterized protein LOC126626404 isoform X2 n=1 Tax=Malus sylvestris TaxID=3752 RepID=UPI000498FB9D|nr:uncharacterized protein LOC126626404 isoform X2 [Malus sylvestris]